MINQNTFCNYVQPFIYALVNLEVVMVSFLILDISKSGISSTSSLEKYILWIGSCMKHMIASWVWTTWFLHLIIWQGSFIPQVCKKNVFSMKLASEFFQGTSGGLVSHFHAEIDQPSIFSSSCLRLFLNWPSCWGQCWPLLGCTIQCEVLWC